MANVHVYREVSLMLELMNFLTFLIYVNDLSENLQSNPKHLADEASCLRK